MLFPEAFVSRYPKGLDFCARIGIRTPAGREDFRRYYESAIETPGSACAALGAVARDTRTCLVIKVVERDRGTLYCSLLIFAPDGVLLRSDCPETYALTEGFNAEPILMRRGEAPSSVHLGRFLRDPASIRKRS